MFILKRQATGVAGIPIALLVAVLIGPEGGFSEKEAQMLADRGIAGVSLGRTILRTETAGPAAIAMIMYELEM